ncbi:MAG TPA: SDR family oxidoreductase [Pyrinomonadaceae bacterium]|nr:SDR family oxidoreductase [Pyrinomonadaceae bacterium]
MVNLEGKTVLVIGAGRGIGRGAAELFSDAGANVALSSRNEAELMELEYKLNTKGNSNVFSFEADASVETDVKALVEETVKKFGAIDYLVHAAGLGILKPFGELTLADFDALVNANVRTAFNALQAVLPAMAERKFGRVVMIPGILGKAPMIQASAYCAAKYALTGMTKCLAQEYKRFGIRFSLMHFGGVDSSFWDNITMKVQRDKMLSVDAAANAVFFAATQEGEGVMAEIVLMPENHQLI